MISQCLLEAMVYHKAIIDAESLKVMSHQV